MDRKKLLKINDVRQLLKYTANSEKTIHSQNKWSHEKLKCFVIYLLKKAGHKVYSESSFRNSNLRPDVIDACCHTIIEVLDSETDEMFESKKFTYPGLFTVVALKVGEFDDEGIKKFLGVD